MPTKYNVNEVTDILYNEVIKPKGKKWTWLQVRAIVNDVWKRSDGKVDDVSTFILEWLKDYGWDTDPREKLELKLEGVSLGEKILTQTEADIKLTEDELQQVADELDSMKGRLDTMPPKMREKQGIYLEKDVDKILEKLNALNKKLEQLENKKHEETMRAEEYKRKYEESKGKEYISKIPEKTTGIWNDDLIEEFRVLYNDRILKSKLNPSKFKDSFKATIMRLKSEGSQDKAYLKDELFAEADELISIWASQKGIAPPEPSTKRGGFKTASDFGSDEEPGGGGNEEPPSYTSGIKPRKDKKAMAYPRKLSQYEIKYFYAAYADSMRGSGIFPRESDFMKYFAKGDSNHSLTYRSFNDAETAFNEFIKMNQSNSQLDFPRLALLEERVGSLSGIIGGETWIPDSTVTDDIIHSLNILFHNRKAHQIENILDNLKERGYNYGGVEIINAIKNAYYANKDAKDKGEVLPFYELHDLTKQDYENTLQENLPDKEKGSNTTP